VLQLEEVQLDDVVRDAARTLEMMSKARRVSIHIVVVEGMPTIAADPERLADAIYHLMHNAVKFNRSGGEVNVRCGYRDGWATVDVEDTGRGIPADKLEALGAPFAQLADSERRGLEGMGLGLALIKYVAQAHGGRLEIESKLGVGSTFCFQIPVGGPASRLTGRSAGLT
jgi:two-component system phosphate regulon sensor histidine kinase PhoR